MFIFIIYISVLEAFPGLKFCLIKDKKSSQFTSAPVNPIMYSRKENNNKIYQIFILLYLEEC